VQRFKQLVRTLKETLSDVKVFVARTAEGDAYIVGRTDWGGRG
jgi:hypothetical protein